MQCSFRLFVINRYIDKELLFASNTLPPDNYVFSDIIVLSHLDDISRLIKLQTNSFFLNITKSGQWTISAFVPPTNCLFVLIHKKRTEESVKVFLREAYEAFAKLCLNPFFDRYNWSQEYQQQYSDKPIQICIFRKALSTLPLSNVLELLQYVKRSEVKQLLLSDYSLNGRHLRHFFTINEKTNESQVSLYDINHDCPRIRLKAVKQFCHHISNEAFELLCTFGCTDVVSEIRQESVSTLRFFSSFASNALCTLNRKDQTSSISGIFVCALEDEHALVRLSALATMRSFSAESQEFAQIAIDHMADMLNDEIKTVRLEAIKSIRFLLELYEDAKISDFVDLLSCLEDISPEIRCAFRGVLKIIRLQSIETVKTVVTEGLTRNLNRYPEDKLDIWACSCCLGANHDDIVCLLHGDLLNANPLLTLSEPDFDDPFYVTILLFIINGLFKNDKSFESPYDIPFLEKHIQAIRVIDSSFLPQLLRIKNDVYLKVTQEMLSNVVNLCCTSNHGMYIDLFTAFDSTEFEGAARFYAKQADVYSSYHLNRSQIKNKLLDIFCTFEDIQNIYSFIRFAQLLISDDRSNKLPQFLILPNDLCLFQRQINNLTAESKDIQCVAGLLCPIKITANLVQKRSFDIYAQVQLPDGCQQLHYIIPNRQEMISDDTYHVGFTLFLNLGSRPWTGTGMVRIQLGCMCDICLLKTLNLPFESRLDRFVPMSEQIIVNVLSIPLMY